MTNLGASSCSAVRRLVALTLGRLSSRLKLAQLLEVRSDNLVIGTEAAVLALALAPQPVLQTTAPATCKQGFKPALLQGINRGPVASLIERDDMPLLTAFT